MTTRPEYTSVSYARRTVYCENLACGRPFRSGYIADYMGDETDPVEVCSVKCADVVSAPPTLPTGEVLRYDRPPVCDACKRRPGVVQRRPWGNPSYCLLDLCKHCDESGVLYATS